MHNIPTPRANFHPTNELPDDLDPVANPIICQHWYGIAPTALAAERRFQEQVEHLHQLGARPVGELLTEIGNAHDIGPDIRERLARYATLDPGVVDLLGARSFVEFPLQMVGGRR